MTNDMHSPHWPIFYPIIMQFLVSQNQKGSGCHKVGIQLRVCGTSLAGCKTQTLGVSQEGAHCHWTGSGISSESSSESLLSESELDNGMSSPSVRAWKKIVQHSKITKHNNLDGSPFLIVTICLNIKTWVLHQDIPYLCFKNINILFLVCCW